MPNTDQLDVINRSLDRAEQGLAQARDALDLASRHDGDAAVLAIANRQHLHALHRSLAAILVAFREAHYEATAQERMAALAYDVERKQYGEGNDGINA